MAEKRSRSKNVPLFSSNKRPKGGSRLEEEEEKKEGIAALVNDDSPKKSSTPSTKVTFNICPRENDFTARSWWLVDVDSEIENDETTTSQGATALVKRCMRIYDWDIEKARKILKAYRQFLTLKKELKDWDATLLSPCLLVEQIWHQHILDVVNYNYDMMLLCGHIIGHNPDGALDEEAKSSREERTRDALKDRFGEYDAEIWSYPSSIPAARRSRDPENRMTSERIRDDPENLLTLEPIRDDGLTLQFTCINYEEEETMLRVSKTTKMSTIFNFICEQRGLDLSQTMFLILGKGGIDGFQTPLTLQLKDSDTIHYLYRMSGIIFES